METNCVYLIFSKTQTWLSRVIRTITTMKYVHTSISFDDSFKKMYSFGRVNPDNPFSAGFVEEDLRKGVYLRSKKCECLIYKVAVSEEQFDILSKQVGFFAKEKERFRYNFLGLFGILFRFPMKRKDSYFCSQFVGEILANSQVFDCGKKPELITSDDLLLLKNRDIVWEGFINEFVARLPHEVVNRAS